MKNNKLKFKSDDLVKYLQTINFKHSGLSVKNISGWFVINNHHICICRKIKNAWYGEIEHRLYVDGELKDFTNVQRTGNINLHTVIDSIPFALLIEGDRREFKSCIARYGYALKDIEACVSCNNVLDLSNDLVKQASIVMDPGIKKK